MSMVNRAAGRSSRNKIDTSTIVTKQTVIKTESVKTAEKEKKQPTPDQIRLASLIDKGESQNTDIQEKINKIKVITCNTEDEIATALHDCDFMEEAAVTYLLEGKQDGWSTTTKRKKSRTASASKNESEVNHRETNNNVEDWERDAQIGSGHQNDRSSRGFRGRRGGNVRPTDRGSFNNSRRWRGRENKENERGGDDGRNITGNSGRDYRGRGDRISNGPQRLGRGGRGGPRGGRGPPGSRTFQSKDSTDRTVGGFPHQIDTWNNPDTDNTVCKVDEFPSPEDWDNEEYTGSLADSKVFTPSTSIEPEIADTNVPVDGEIKEESLQLHIAIQSSPNASIPTMVVSGSNQLTAAQTQYFNQLATQASENRKQAKQPTQPMTPSKPQQVQPQAQSSVIYNSSISSSPQAFSSAVTQSPFPVVSQSYTAVTPSQSYTSMVSSQTYQQSSSSIAGSASYSRTSSEYTSSNYNDVISNYNSMVVLQSNGALPQRSKSQRPTSRQESSTKVISGAADMPSADGSMNSAMKYLDAQFSALDFNSTDNFDSSTGTNDQNGVTALTNKFAQGVPANSAPHADLPAINSFQATQSSQQVHSAANMSAVLNQNNKLSSESTLQNDNSVYSSQTIANSRIASGIQDLNNTAEVSSLPYGISEAYQPQQPQSTFQKTSSGVSSSFHQPGTSVQASQQAPQPSQMNNTGVTYSTSSGSTSFSVYGSNNHSVATATPPLHNSVYHNSSYQPHPSVSASFQSYMSYPSSLMPPYQAGAAGLTQPPYLSTQYGGGSLASLGATYGATPFHNNYSMGSNMQTPVATLQQNHKLSNSLSTNASACKDSQYDSLQTMTSAAGSTTTTNGTVISGLSQASSATSSKVSSSSSSGNKLSGMLPSLPPGVTPLLGPATPQYIMSQGTLPLYQPAYTLNFDELQYLPRGMHPHMPAGYLDLNYAAAPQTNLATAGRETLNVPFSSMSDGRFPRPDTTTSPVPPNSASAAAGGSLSQQNTAATHQQTHLPMYATYIYPPAYQQYTTPVYQVAHTANPTAPGASTNAAAITGTPFAKGPAGYSSTGYASQYDSLSSSQGSVADYTGKSNSANSYSNTQPPSKAGANTANVSGQNSNAANADLSMYGKSHASLAKSYDNKAFHSNTPPPYTIPGSGTTSNSLGSNTATGYAPQLFIPNVPNAAAAAHQQHHVHQNVHHQDGTDMRSTGANDRNFFMSSNRATYR